jgi:5-methylcytosine-specific restriction endonuclease McrA
MQSFSVEHIVPISQGGNDMLDNLALACQGCNGQNLISLRKILYALEEHPPII